MSDETVKPSNLSPAELEAAIANALKAGDIEAVAILLRWLSTIDANRAQVVFDTLELGVALARRRDVEHKRTDRPALAGPRTERESASNPQGPSAPSSRQSLDNEKTDAG